MEAADLHHPHRGAAGLVPGAVGGQPRHAGHYCHDHCAMTSCRHCAVNGGEVGGGEHRGHSGPAPHLPTLPQIQVGLVALQCHILLNRMLSGVISLLPMSV